MILKMVRNVDDAEDLMIRSFAKAFRSLHQFKGLHIQYLCCSGLRQTIPLILFGRKRSTRSASNTYTDDDGSGLYLSTFRTLTRIRRRKAIKAQKEELIQVFVGIHPPNIRNWSSFGISMSCLTKSLQELDAPTGTVKAQLHRARELILRSGTQQEGALHLITFSFGLRPLTRRVSASCA